MFMNLPIRVVLLVIAGVAALTDDDVKAGPLAEVGGWRDFS
jgi:hypothetical protein